MGFIYTITNKKNNKVYVGYTSNFIKRKSSHLRNLLLKKHENIYLQNAFNSVGIENIIIEILEEYENEYLPSFENWWCIALNSHNNKFGYNIKGTGPIANCVSTSEETKKKLSEANKGRKHSEETKRKISEAVKKRGPVSDETRKKQSLSQKGKKKHNQESRKKISEAVKKRVVKQETREKNRIAATNRKITFGQLVSIKVVDIKTNQIYNSIKEAADSIGMTLSCLSKQLNGKRKNKTNFECYAKTT
jgi:group I intron endonuclease